MLSRDEILEVVSRYCEDRAVAWYTGPMPFDGRERTLLVFYAEVDDRRRLQRALRPIRAELDQAAGGPIVFMYFTKFQTERWHMDEVRAWFHRPQTVVGSGMDPASGEPPGPALPGHELVPAESPDRGVQTVAPEEGPQGRPAGLGEQLHASSKPLNTTGRQLLGVPAGSGVIVSTMSEQKIVHIMQGPQGAGKSTFTDSVAGAHVCSADEFFMVDGLYTHEVAKLKDAHQACLRKYVDGLLNQRPVIIVDNTNSARWEMGTYVQLAKAYGYEVEIHTFIIDPKVAFARNRHNVPWDVLLRTVMFMESPLATWGRHTIHLPDGTVISSHLDDPKPELG